MKLKGFTLIELLVVISIIGLLSSVVTASLNSAREKGRLSAALQFSSQVEHVAGEQAIGIWDFDECSGTTAGDRSGNGNNGTLMNMAATSSWSADTPYPVGCSLSFDGTDDYVRISDSPSLKFGASDMTYSFWMNYAGTPNGIAIGKYTYSGNHLGFWIWVQSSGSFSANVGDGVDSVSLGATGLKPSSSAWHFVTVTIDRSAALMTMYEDGRMIGNRVSIASIDSISNSAGLEIGSDGTHTSGRHFAGLIDGVRIYGKVLTASEVGELYARESARAVFANRMP